MDHTSTSSQGSHPSSPAMDIMPPKVADAPPVPVSEAPKTAPVHAKKPTVVRAPREPHMSMGPVILATVIIVLGLGVLFMYAYLRTNNISVF